MTDVTKRDTEKPVQSTESDQQAQVNALSPDQIATPPAGYPFIDTLRVKVLYGPWAGQILMLPNDGAVQAITDKWAVDYVEEPLDANAVPPVPLTAEEEAAATAAATQYATDWPLSGGGGEPQPVVPPVASSAAMNGTDDAIVISFDKALDGSSTPAASAFAIMVDSVAKTATTVTVAGVAKTVTLALDAAYAAATAVSVSYTPPATNKLKGSDGAVVAAFTDLSVSVS